jgi:hypothetical protein
MADDRDARIAQLEAENRVLRERENVACERAAQTEAALTASLEQESATAGILRAIATAPSA